jgi:hypothetical protein
MEDWQASDSTFVCTGFGVLRYNEGSIAEDKSIIENSGF